MKNPLNRILVVEDDPDAAEIISGMLQPLGCEIDVAHNAEQARALLARNDYSAMTLDIMMPGQDGFSFLGELRAQEKTQDLPVVIVSVCGMGEEKHVAISQYAIADWITKPLNPERLVSSVKRALMEKSSRGQAKILHVESHHGMRDLVSILLRRMGRVISVGDLKGAKTLLKIGHFDLVILDSSLPERDESELLSLVGSAPVIVISAEQDARAAADKIFKGIRKLDSFNPDFVEAVRLAVQKSKNNP